MVALRHSFQESLAHLGIDDISKLSDFEKQARVVDLLRARSGVYHESAYEPAGMKRRRPERGSAKAGENWFYNNWDFNVLGTIFEQRSGSRLAEQFERKIAAPLGMEDFAGRDVFEFLEPSKSLHAAHLFRMSARDMARVGVMVLQQGRFADRQIVSKEWLAESTRIQTEFDKGNPYGAAGYGYLWWIYAADQDAERPFSRVDSIVARGNGGQVLAILPEAELVFVHCGDWYYDRGVTFEDATAILDRVLLARHEPAGDPPAVGPVQVRAFDHSLPAPERPEPVVLPEETLQAMVGLYRVSPELAFRLYLYRGRLFAEPRGAPLSEVELLPVGEGRFYSPIFPLKVEVLEVSDVGRVEVIQAVMGPMKMEARRESEEDE